MRLVNYKVTFTDGTTGNTTSFKEATENGNRIKEIFLTAFSLAAPTEKQEQDRLDHICKVDKFFEAKRG